MVNTGRTFRSADSFNKDLFQSLQIGFYFGIAYAFVDSVQDEINNPSVDVLKEFFMKSSDERSSDEAIDRCLQVVEQILSGCSHSPETSLPDSPFNKMIFDSFEQLFLLTRKSNIAESSFNELSLLLRSQRFDKKQFSEKYNDTDLYIGSILKSHFTYTCSTHLADMASARVEQDRLWSMPFLGQLTDDCRDFNEDVSSSSVTPYTYYAQLVKRKDPHVRCLTNPLVLFLNLCADIYLSTNRDPSTGAFLGRRIVRSLRSIIKSKDESSYYEFVNTFSSNNQTLFDYLWNRLRKQFGLVTDPEKHFFRAFDRLSSAYSRTNRKLETFVFENLGRLETSLEIHKVNNQQPVGREEQILIAAMNYSVKAGGKRLRMLLLIMIADLYQIPVEKVTPLACAIEYLHTSSLIIDDLPAQDNSDLRRGRPTLHKTVIDHDVPDNLCEGRAQLAAVDLIAVSMNVIKNSLLEHGFPIDKILEVIGEISQLMHNLCVGQMMDLCAARSGISSTKQAIEELDRIASLKTGKAIEAVIVLPAILASSTSVDRRQEFERLRELSRLMGILFQMKDDLLDIEASETIGKPQSLDLKNNTVTYVTLLGVDGARQRLDQYLYRTLDLVDQAWPGNAETVKDVVRHIASRKT